MNLGLAIFLSSILLGIIFLFHSTKDRWKWKKITKISSIIILVSILIIAVYYSFFFKSGRVFYNGPTKATSLWEVKLGDSKKNVKFLKGNPDRIDSLNTVWIYLKEYYYRNDECYKVVFNNNIVTSIVYFGDYPSPGLLGRNFVGYNLKSLEDYLGKPSDVFSSKDGLSRVYSFNNYNVVFFMRTNRVYGYGVYNPNYGTYKY